VIFTTARVSVDATASIFSKPPAILSAFALLVDALRYRG
jgi:hypothetical protein